MVDYQNLSRKVGEAADLISKLSFNQRLNAKNLGYAHTTLSQLVPDDFPASLRMQFANIMDIYADAVGDVDSNLESMDLDSQQALQQQVFNLADELRKRSRARKVFA